MTNMAAMLNYAACHIILLPGCAYYCTNWSLVLHCSNKYIKQHFDKQLSLLLEAASLISLLMVLHQRMNRLLVWVFLKKIKC